MQAFLPSGYSFSPDKLINQSKYQSLIDSFQKNKQLVYTFYFLAIVSFIIIVSIGSLWQKEKDNDGGRIIGFALLASSLSAICGVCLDLQNTINMGLFPPSAYYETAYFKYPVRSNLNVHMLDKNNRPKNTNDHKKYPYEIYLRHPKKYQFDVDGPTLVVSGHYELKTNKPIHIGKMQDNKFIPANNHLAAIFNKYYTYIMKHDLSDKFADTMIFKPNINYLTINGDVQWVLSNDKDLVLYLHNGSTVKESKITKD